MAPSVEVCNASYLFSLLFTRMYTNVIVYETGTIGHKWPDRGMASLLTILDINRIATLVAREVWHWIT